MASHERHGGAMQHGFPTANGRRPTATRHRPGGAWKPGGYAALSVAAGAVLAQLSARPAAAASSTFVATPTSNNFNDPNDWANTTVPGATGTTTDTSTATFNQTVTNGIGIAGNPLLIDPGRNLQNITFDTAAASAYVIGIAGGNPLLLTSGGTIQVTSTVVNAQAVNGPLVIEPASATTAGTYTFASSATNAAAALTISGPVTLGATTAFDTLNLAGTNTGANDFGGTVSDAGTAGLVLNKSGAGSWTFGGNGTSTLAKGNVTVNGGTLNFGSATETPSLTINGTTGSGVGVFVVTGNFNMNAGNLSVASAQGLVLNGNNTYAQTGGTFSTNGLIEFANGSAAVNSVVNIAAGSLTTTARAELAVRGSTTVNLTGTGVFNTSLGSLVLTTTQLTSGTANGTFNLSGGTLITGQVVNGTGGPTGPGNTFNFNGGTLQATASTASFMTGLTNAAVLAGGAVVNTNGFNDTIGQNLLASATSTGGGLTKNGTGTLTLTGTDTYTGVTTVAAGTLQVGSGTVSGDIAASTGIVLAGTGLTFNQAAPYTYANPVIVTTGSTITQSGSSPLTLSGVVTASDPSAAGTAVTLNLTGTGAGTATFGGLNTGTAAGGVILNKTGTGAWTFGGNATSTLAKGTITQSAGTFNFGSATDAPTLTLAQPAAGATGGLSMTGGTFNVNAGSLAVTNTVANTTNISLSGATLTVNGGALAVTNSSAGNGGVGIYVSQFTGGAALNVFAGSVTTTVSQGLVLGGATASYTQTGGTFGTTGLIEFANNAGASTVAISGGALTTTSANANDATDLAVRGTTTVNLSGTGTFTTPVLNMTTSQIANGTGGNGPASSTFNLNGGTLVTGRIILGTNAVSGAGGVFNFNGGTLQASANSTTFMAGLTAANVQAGGAVVNTNGFNVSIGQPLLAGTGNGGLTKNGLGTLTLSGPDTYAGPTAVNVGTLAVTGAIGTGTTTVLAGATLSGTGTVGGSVSQSGTIDPGVVNGVATGTLTVSALTVAAGSATLAFDLSGNASDTLAVTGGITFTATPTVAFGQQQGLTASKFVLVTSGATTLATTQFNLPPAPAGYAYAIGSTGGSDLELDATATPEPASLALLLLGMGSPLVGRRRRR